MEAHGNIANIKRKISIPNFSLFQYIKELPSRFQRNINVKVEEVSDYNSKQGNLEL